jgi:hypothetical protein
MEIMGYEETVREIFRRYNKKPDGWQVLMGRSLGGFYDMLFSSPDGVWQLKLDTIYRPNPIGFGVRLEEDSSKVPIMEAPPYGHRPVHIDGMMVKIKHLMESKLQPEQMMSNIIENIVGTLDIERIMESPPLPTDRIRTPITAIGPYIQQPTIEPISSRQKELSTKLDDELKRLMRIRYPWYR